MSEQLNLEKTALVLIDLQEGIVNRSQLEPYSKEEIIDKMIDCWTSSKIQQDLSFLCM